MKRTFRLRVDDEEMVISVDRVGDNLTVEHNGESILVSLLGEETPSQERATAPATPAPAAPQAPRPAPASTSPQPAPTSAPAGSVGAPITGTIKEVLVNEGESIAQGDRILMMEAMKMDIEVVAPSAGKLSHVFVKAGDTVKEHQPLFSIQ